MSSCQTVAVRRLLPLLLLGACDSEPLHFYVDGPMTVDQRDAMDEAAALIGHELIRARSKYGAVHIRFDDPESFPPYPPLPDGYYYVGGGDRASGSTPNQAQDCTRRLRVAYPPAHQEWLGTTVAHELGHAFRLSHVGDPTDVMTDHAAEGVDQDYFGDQEKLDRRINRFTRWCLR